MVPENAFKAAALRLETEWQVARRLFKERRLRSEHFSDSELFGEPARDILLHLFLGVSTDRGVSIESVPIASGLSMTSTLRWLEVLESKGLVFAYRE